jgi:hypothetical protein
MVTGGVLIVIIYRRKDTLDLLAGNAVASPPLPTHASLSSQSASYDH